MTAQCDLCESAGGDILWRNDLLRVVRVADPDYPAYLRVIWEKHVREITDLDPPARAAFWTALLALETAIREVARPDKVNLAVFGNMTPHLHGHVMARWSNDRHFPNPVWGAVTHPEARPPAVDGVQLAARVCALLDAAFGGEGRHGAH